MIISGTRIRGGKYYGTTSDPYFSLVTLLLPANGTNGAQNETFIDGSTNNFALTATGNPTQGSFSPFSPSGYSNYFDGTGDNLKLPVSARTALGAIAGTQMTYEFWIFTTNIQATTSFDSAIFSIYAPVAENSRYMIAAYASAAAGPQNIHFRYTTSTSTETSVTSTATLPINAWSHVAITVDATTAASSTIKIFINGQGETFTGQDLSTHTTVPAVDPYIGTGYQLQNLTGYLSNFRIVRGSLVYTSNFTPPTTPLTAIAGTQLLTCQSNRFIDNSSNNFTLTIAGETMVRPFSPFLQPNQYKTAANGGSAAFDGSGDYIRTAAVNQSAFAFGTGDFTWECWIYPTSSPAGNNRIIGFITTGGTLQAQLYTASSGTVLAYDQGASTPYSQTYSQGFNNQWSHIAVSRVSGTSRVFVNGIQLAASFADTINYAASRFVMGTDPSSLAVYYAGYITGVKIINGTGLYTANFTCPTSPPTATDAQLLLNFTNAGIVDAAAKNNLETVGDASLSTAQSKWGTSSIYFDGTGDWLLSGLGPTNADSQLRTGNFTIELWVYLASADVGSARGLVSKGTSTTGYSVSLNSTEKVVFSFTTSTITSTGSMPTDSWVHIAVVRSGTGANLTKIYINGVNDGTGTVSTDFNQTNSLYVGADRVAGSPMKGYIQDLRITRGVARYTANFAPPTQPFPTQ